MKIIVTGATGFVGRGLVPALAALGVELLLVGREPEHIRQLYPGMNSSSYEDLDELGAGFDLLVHLAVANNNADLPPEAYYDVNVRLLLDTAKRARRAGVPCFVNISSLHALDPCNDSTYAKTKREAARLLADLEGIKVITAYLPAVHGDRWSGKLAFLNAMPRWLAPMLFLALAALRPTMHVSHLARFLIERTNDEDDREVILSDGQQENRFYSSVKRAMDLAFALSVVLLFWWGLALIWALVRLQSPGPGIFAQKRVGQGGAAFTCYKFRTMKDGTMEAGTNEIPLHAVTGFGRFLRRTKLDELPQIWNILRNEVSLIGPRPCLPMQTVLIEARRRRGVLRAKPGISGLAQINHIDMSEPEKLARWDARYLALQSLLLDLKIVWATATGRGRGDRIAGGN